MKVAREAFPPAVLLVKFPLAYESMSIQVVITLFKKNAPS